MVSIREDGRVEFKFYRPGAASVRIAGDFDNWAGSVAMRSAGRGWWIFDAQLPPGEYRFRYVADAQQWYTDYAAFGVEQAKNGGWNSVLIVPEIAASIDQIDSAASGDVEELEEMRVAA
jgi:1,4-alpha-glucan branching enzyme